MVTQPEGISMDDPPRLLAGRFAKERLPNLLGIGAAKAGTTWFAGLLAEHPEIFLHPQKELNGLHYADLDERIGEYQAYFHGSESRAFRCDFSVRYLNSSNATRAAKRLVPGAKILVILRDPVDQLQSHYWHLRRQNFHQPHVVSPAPDIFEAIERFPDLLLEPALYGKHLSRWREHFPREQFLVIDYVSLVKDVNEALHRVHLFLGLQPEQAEVAGGPRAADRREGRGGVQPRPGLMGSLYPHLYFALTRGPYRWLKRAAGVRTAERLKRMLRFRQIGERLFFEPGYQPLDPAGRARLRQIFADDRRLLQSLDMHDMSGWS